MVRAPFEVRYARGFSFPQPPATVWAALEQVDQFEQWWAWLGDLRVQGGGLHTGSVLEATVAPPLPYRMGVRVELEACRPTSEIDAAVHGDLEGWAQLRLRAEGSGTRAEVRWRIEMMQRSMRLAALVGSPLLRWGHDRVVEATVLGLRDHLGREG